jgi:hypothetical protein
MVKEFEKEKLKEREREWNKRQLLRTGLPLTSTNVFAN